MGKLIVIEGLDGCGKSTQLELLPQSLAELGVECQTVSFPNYDSDSSALVKMYLSGEFGSKPGDVNAYAASTFYAVDRYASYKKFWEQEYQQDLPIIAARYTTSNAIHQMAKLPKSEWDNYLEWMEHYEYVLLGLPRPDAVIFLDMPLDIAQKLMSHRYEGDESKKDIHERDLQYLRQCRESALYAAQKCGWQVVTCGAGDAPLPPEVITEKLVHIFEETVG